MSFHSDTLSWFQANQSLLLLLNAACLAEKKEYLSYSVMYGLTQLGLDSTIYHTWDEHTNHNTTDAITSNC
jgi:hypothetical protein